MPVTGSQTAQLPALAGVMRAATARAAGHSAKVFVSINGLQYAFARTVAAQKVMVSSLAISDVLGETPNTCSFDLSGFRPGVGYEVIITLGSINNLVRLFAGHIVVVEQRYEGKPDNALFRCNAIDYTWLLNAKKVLKQYTNQSATDIAIDLITSCAPAGFTTVNVAAGLATIDLITFTNQDLPNALTQLAKRIGAYWTVDYHKDLHFGLTDTSGTNPTSLTPSHRTLMDFQATFDLSQIISRCYVEGGGVNTLTDVPVGDTVLPVSDTSWYLTDGGVVVCGPQRISYTSLDAGGAGSLVGTGASPASGPTLASVVGAPGVESGAHEYAVTFVTGAGESIVGPRVPITVGNTAAPANPMVLAAPTPGTGPEPGVHDYGVTFVTATGETTTSPRSSVTTSLATLAPPYPNYLTPFSAPAAGSLDNTKYYAYQVTYVDALGGETTPTDYNNGTQSGTRPTGSTFTLQYIPVSTFPAAKRKIYRTVGAASPASCVGLTRFLCATINDNTTTTVDDGLADGSLGAAAPTTNTAVYTAEVVPISAIPIGPTGVTSRKLYRSAAGGGQQKLLATIADNTTTTYSDTVPDASLGANIPTSNTATANHVDLTAIPIGPAAVTSRKVYRTVAGALGTTLKLLTTVADNVTTTYADATADASLGAAAPGGDTSGLTQPSGQVLAGSTTLLLAGAGSFRSAGGWVISGGGQFIRYTGISGNSLTGIPSSGAGAITATISYNSTVTSAPMLLGIPATGTGAILYAILQGDPVNVLAQIESVGAQSDVITILAGAIPTGVIEDYIQDGRLSYSECVLRGTARVDLLDQAEARVLFLTRDQNTVSGRTITVALTPPTVSAVSGTFKIQSVTISNFSANGVAFPTYEAAGSTVRFGYEDLLRKLRALVSDS